MILNKLDLLCTWKDNLIAARTEVEAIWSELHASVITGLIAKPCPSLLTDPQHSWSSQKRTNSFLFQKDPQCCLHRDQQGSLTSSQWQELPPPPPSPPPSPLPLPLLHLHVLKKDLTCNLLYLAQPTLHWLRSLKVVILIAVKQRLPAALPVVRVTFHLETSKEEQKIPNHLQMN